MKVIITGSTGMVGKAALIECLESDQITEVLVINRSPIKIQHQKLKEIILRDFSDVNSIQQELRDYDACFYCLGISSMGMKEEAYHRITYGITESLVNVLYPLNPDLVFIYVSATGTDSSEQGNSMWARVKGKAENMIFNRGFKDAYAFRPGAILPEKGVKSRTALYNFMYILTKPFYPLMKKMKSITTSTNVGKAMINVVLRPQELKILENKDINITANKSL